MATLSLGMSREQFSGFLLNDYGIRDDTTTVAEARAAADHNNTWAIYCKRWTEAADDLEQADCDALRT